MSEQRRTILVTGVGAVIGYGIIKSLKQGRHDLRIIGMDIYEDAYGRYLSDEFVKAIPAQSPGYGDFIAGIIERYEIDLVIPGIEQDLYSLHRLAGTLSSNAKIVMNNDLCIELSKDKLLTYEYFKEHGANVIPTLTQVNFAECAARLSLPFLIKPRSGYASKGIHTIATEEEFIFYSRHLQLDCIFQRIIGSIDSEYTISLFGDGRGSYFDSIILKRQLSREGATSKAQLIEKDDKISEFIAQVCQWTNPVGPTNIQIRSEGGIPYLLEINPRISSACSIRTLMGYNEPDMCVDYFLLGIKPLKQTKRPAKAVRFIDDHIMYE